MRFEFKLPDVGEGISEAELLEWRVAVGDTVKEDDEIGVFSTDKVTVELPSPCAGKVLSLHGQIGEVIPVGTVLAVIERADGAGTAQRSAPATSAKPSASAAGNGGSNGASHPAATRQHAVPAAVQRMAEPAPQSGPIIAAPSTRRMARELDVDLSRVVGSGPGGRILRADVQAAASGGPGLDAPAQAPAHRPAPIGEVRRVPLSGARAVSARNLHQSVQQTVTTTSTFEVRGDGLKNLLSRLKPQAEKRGLKLSPVHLMAKCVGAALARHERFNATIDETTGDLLLHESVDLGVAVAAGDKLVVPVLRGIQHRLLFDVVTEISAIAERARDGKLQVSDLRGGTFTLSSTGGMERANMISTRPIISPPQTAILWMSRIADRPRVEQGQLTVGPMMVCSLSFDHRYIDGAEATLFINELAELLEQPELAIV